MDSISSMAVLTQYAICFSLSVIINFHSAKIRKICEMKDVKCKMADG
jgi:hypothetical protein